ncbi:MAG: AmmeMemoRadiSam system protein B [Treponema sp.]|jgi:AmmeMemoRadiSam system protein B|nr:AmmeMemoRadiSam system protein B [Treponema sp.]
MQIREYSLSAGWYPRDSEEVSKTISRFLKDFSPPSNPSRAVIAPHAGWYYSGRIAAIAAASLVKDAETVIVLGGHLGAGSPALFAMEDAVKTPFGPIYIDSELRSLLLKELDGTEDHYRDNTIEVLLPMVRFFFPKAKLLWLRLPAEIRSFEAGKVISSAATEIGRKAVILASNDLTHYGSNYGFSPKGKGEAALRWVRDENDAGFIRAIEDGNTAEVLRRANHDRAACCAGSVLGAMGFAQAENLGNARLLLYGTSADVEENGVPDSFVGYAALAF